MNSPCRALFPWLNIIRPLNGLVAASAVLLGAWLSGGQGLGPAMLLAAGSAFLVNGFGNVVNDLVDRDIDAVNRPGRPLPSGGISLRGAQVYSGLLLLFGLSCARAVSPLFLYMAFGTALLLWLYSFVLKGTILLGNVVVSGLTAFTLVYGGLLSAAPERVFFPALFAFFSNLAREIVKDMADAEGDRINGMVTLPVRFGFGAAGNLTVIILVLLVLLSFVPWKIGLFHGFYLPAVILLADIPLTFAAIRIVRPGGDPRSLNRTAGIIKIAMAGGMLAIVLGV